jgi:hypothetical protein
MSVTRPALRFNSAVFAEAFHALVFCSTNRFSASLASSHAPSVGSLRLLFQLDKVTRVSPASFAI